MKNKKDERIMIGELVLLSVDKMEKEGVGPDYTCYIMFSVLGSMILECEGIERLDEYVKEIKMRNLVTNTDGPSAAH